MYFQNNGCSAIKIEGFIETDVLYWECWIMWTTTTVNQILFELFCEMMSTTYRVYKEVNHLRSWRDNMVMMTMDISLLFVTLVYQLQLNNKKNTINIFSPLINGYTCTCICLIKWIAVSSETRIFCSVIGLHSSVLYQTISFL